MPNCILFSERPWTQEWQTAPFTDFLPLLIYVLVHCGLVSAEIEADYMWGLLHPSVLTGEGGYYLTTLSSAVLILKNFQEAHESRTASLEVSLSLFFLSLACVEVTIPPPLPPQKTLRLVSIQQCC